MAYPSRPSEIGRTIAEALETLRRSHGIDGVESWEENDIGGQFFINDILDKIRSRELLVADITKTNFNVFFEIGFAIGTRRRVLTVQNTAIQNDADLVRTIGLFDTIGHESYERAEQLAALIARVDSAKRHAFDPNAINRNRPVYLLKPPKITDDELAIIRALDRAQLRTREFDSSETARLSASSAIREVAMSLGVVAPLVSKNRVDAPVHNLRVAFVAGLAYGMNKQLQLYMRTDTEAPLDVRDLADEWSTPNKLGEYANSFGLQLFSELQKDTSDPGATSSSTLASLSFGEPVAENEADKSRANNYMTAGGSSWSMPKQMAAAARLAQASMTMPDLS